MYSAGPGRYGRPVDDEWRFGLALTQAAWHRVPMPTTPPPGRLDEALALLVERAAPFDRASQAWLLARCGWGSAPPVGGEPTTPGQRAAWRRLRALLSACPPRGQVETAVAVLEAAGPLSAPLAALELVRCGVTSQPVHPAGVMRLATMLGVEHCVQLCEQPRECDVVPAAIRARLRARGYLRVPVAPVWGPGELAAAGVRWLAEGRLLFAARLPTGRLTQRAARIVYAAQRVEVEAIAAGVARAAGPAERADAPSAQELLVMLEGVTWAAFDAAAGTLTATGATEVAARLRRVDTVVIGALRRAGGSTSTSALRAALVAAGTPASSVDAWLARMPFVTSGRRGSWSLVGHR